MLIIPTGRTHSPDLDSTLGAYLVRPNGDVGYVGYVYVSYGKSFRSPDLSSLGDNSYRVAPSGGYDFNYFVYHSYGRYSPGIGNYGDAYRVLSSGVAFSHGDDYYTINDSYGKDRSPDYDNDPDYAFFVNRNGVVGNYWEDWYIDTSYGHIPRTHGLLRVDIVLIWVVISMRITMFIIIPTEALRTMALLASVMMHIISIRMVMLIVSMVM